MILHPIETAGTGEGYHAKTHRILIADDDTRMVQLLKDCMTGYYSNILAAYDGCETLKMVDEHKPDLVVLDIMMPRLDGFEVINRLRKSSEIPIIMLSALGEIEDKVKCLTLGADDYLTKPFAVDELIARIEAVLRRSRADSFSQENEPLLCGDLSLDFHNRRVSMGGQDVMLTQTEASLPGDSSA